MNPEQQRIAIAEACGWKNADHPDVMKLKQGWSMPEKWCMDPNGVLQFNHDRPDYLDDLNAMHETEKVLTPDTRPEYLCQLFDAATRGRSGLFPVDENYLSHHATASQRAEAFLRTIGKWEESK